MRRAISCQLSAVSLSLVITLGGCSDREVVETPAPTTVLQVEIRGMYCTGCEQAIAAKVGEIDGVVTCTASHEEGSASVTVHDESVLPDIHAAITELGYEVTLADS